MENLRYNLIIRQHLDKFWNIMKETVEVFPKEGATLDIYCNIVKFNCYK